MATITSTYSKHAQYRPDQIAMKTREQEITYREWNEITRQTASWFHSQPSRKKTVGIYMPNGIPFLQVFVGAAAAGWIAVPLDMKWKEEELRKRMKLCNPDIILTTHELSQRLSDKNARIVIWEEFVNEADQDIEKVEHQVNGDVPFFMGFTSGSTGEPKAFIRYHQSWIDSFACNTVDFHMSEKDTVLILGSLMYTHFLYGVISTLYLGGTIYLLEKFSPSRTIAALRSYPITTVYVVPTMVAALLKEPHIMEQNITFISSGAKWEADSKQRIQDMFSSLCMYEYYGAGELSFVTVLSNQENKERPNSVGKACYQVEIQIRRADQSVADPHEIGTIYVKSSLVIMGYLNHDGIQSFVDKDGWCTVHDMGYMDEEGYLYIVGREKNMILYGGINIFPEEIEAVLAQHPHVELAAVVGVTDPYWGQIVAAVIKGTAIKRELRALCKDKLAPYKVPRKWYFLDEFPLTVSGKISRPQIKEWLEGQVHHHS